MRCRRGYRILRELGSKNFGTVDLGDIRRNRCLIELAAQIARYPEQSLPRIHNWNITSA
ncbi:MAG: transposase [Bacteroidales bacterium]|nr:transposase [Bacteroidales bacterium]